MASLFPGLPDDIGRECLLRVRLSSHRNLRCVSKSWNAVLKSPIFYAERKKLRISEERVCFLQTAGGIRNRILIYDLEKGSYKILPSIPIEIDGNRVCLYDFVDLKWRECARMPRQMNGFASAVDKLRGLIYVAGGYDRYLEDSDEFGDPVRSASVYNVEEDKWDDLPDMNVSMKCSLSMRYRGAFVDGMLFVSARDKGSFQAYYPRKRVWETVWPSNSPSNMLCAFGFFYIIFNNKLYEMNYSDGSYRLVRSMPEGGNADYINFMIAVNNKIFVCKWVGEEGLNGFYMLTPEEEFRLTEIQMPVGLHEFVMEGATLDL